MPTPTLYEKLNEAIEHAAERGVHLVIWSTCDSRQEYVMVAYAAARHGRRVRVAQRMWTLVALSNIAHPQIVVDSINQLVDGVLTRSRHLRHGAPAYTRG